MTPLDGIVAFAHARLAHLQAEQDLFDQREALFRAMSMSPYAAAIAIRSRLKEEGFTPAQIALLGVSEHNLRLILRHPPGRGPLPSQ